MSVSEELLCSFELLKPLDSSALKSHIKKGRNKRNSILNSPVSAILRASYQSADSVLACCSFRTKLLTRQGDFSTVLLAALICAKNTWLY